MRTSIGFHHPKLEHPLLSAKRRSLLERLESSTREDGNDPLILASEVANAIESDAPPLRIVIGDMAKEIIGARRTVPEARFRQLVAERTQLVASSGGLTR